jgi:transcription termination factor Rho
MVLQAGNTTAEEKTADDQKSLVVDDRVLPDSGLPTENVTGVLDIANEGSGLLRPNFIPSDRDVYISASQIRRFNLRTGDSITGLARRPKDNERYWGLLKVETVNGEPAVELRDRPDFENLLAIYPDRQIVLSTGKEPLTTRIMDLVSPIGFGQRGLIVSPPKAGKTWLIKDIITGIGKNHPEVVLMAVLIGERPEEVTDIKRHLEKKGNRRPWGNCSFQL